MASPLRTTLSRALKHALAVLDGAGVRHALVGGIAVSSHAEERFTRDVDLAVSVADDAEAELVVNALVVAGFRIAATLEHLPTGRLATVRLLPPRGRAQTFVDLLFASSGIEPEIVREAERLELAPRLSTPVARVGHLIAMKVLAYDPELRAKDLVDLHALLQVASPAEITRARKALALIRERGHARGKPLLRQLEALIRRRRERGL